MTKVIVFKTKNNTIAVCTPAPYANIVRALRVCGDINAYVNTHDRAGKYEISQGRSRAHCDRRIAWANRIVDFNNITDIEYEALIECDLPDDKQYHYWIDDSLLKKNDALRDAWCDIDAQGNIKYDLQIVAKLQGGT